MPSRPDQAVYLTADARRSGDQALAAQFRSRALAAGAVVLVPSLAWLFVLFQRGQGPAPDS